LSNDGYSNSEDGLTLGLLRAVASDEQLTQRSAASQLGVALGLVNTYLKRCVKKGYIKVRQAPANRYAYYLTPQGLREKGRLTAEFLTQSLSLFRQANQDYAKLFELCERNGWRRIAFHGLSDLTDVAVLFARNFDLELAGIVDAKAAGASHGDLPLAKSLDALGAVDAHIITDLQNPQPVYDALIAGVAPERVLAPSLLELVRIGQTAKRKKK
jgi:DNA-binding MarR family transcriptional regulator